jgi:hypothetical protein
MMSSITASKDNSQTQLVPTIETVVDQHPTTGVLTGVGQNQPSVPTETRTVNTADPGLQRVRGSGGKTANPMADVIATSLAAAVEGVPGSEEQVALETKTAGKNNMLVVSTESGRESDSTFLEKMIGDTAVKPLTPPGKTTEPPKEQNVNEDSQLSFLSRIFGSPSKKKTSVPIQDVTPAAEEQTVSANEKEDKPQNPFAKIVERYKVEGDLFDEETVQAMIAVLEAKKKSKSSTELK